MWWPSSWWSFEKGTVEKGVGGDGKGIACNLRKYNVKIELKGPVQKGRIAVKT